MNPLSTGRSASFGSADIRFGFGNEYLLRKKLTCETIITFVKTSSGARSAQEEKLH